MSIEDRRARLKRRRNPTLQGHDGINIETSTCNRRRGLKNIDGLEKNETARWDCRRLVRIRSKKCDNGKRRSQVWLGLPSKTNL